MTIETFFHAADVFAMPSIVESFGLVTVEAMAAGVPVVAFAGPGTNDLLEGGRCGILVRDLDVAEFADWLEKLSRDKVFGRELIDEGRRFARRFDRRPVARQHIELYEKVISPDLS